MRKLLAAGALSVASLVATVPAANASASAPDATFVEDAATASDVHYQDDLDGQVIRMDEVQARPICKGRLGAKFHTTRCRRAAPGTQFRAAIHCTVAGWKVGPWRNQTRDFSTKSTARCGTNGGVRNGQAIDFR